MKEIPPRYSYNDTKESNYHNITSANFRSSNEHQVINTGVLFLVDSNGRYLRANTPTDEGIKKW